MLGAFYDPERGFYLTYLKAFYVTYILTMGRGGNLFDPMVDLG